MTKAWRGLVLFAAVLCTGWVHARIPSEPHATRSEGFVPRPEVAKAMALGFDALLADYHWLEAVQIVGGIDIVDAAAARHLGQLIDVVTTLNPHVAHPYVFAANWMTQDEELVREGNRLLRRAIHYHPDDWRNYFYLGFNQFYYLGEYEDAAHSLERALALPGAPSYLAALVARLRSQADDLQVAEAFLRQLLDETAEEDVRAKILAALDQIEIEYKARLLDRARAVYRKHTGHDIERVEDLATGPDRVLEELPDPEPDALPGALSRDSVWRIDPRSDRIVSSYVGSRYELHFGSHRPRVAREKPVRAEKPEAPASARVDGVSEGAHSDGGKGG